MTSPGASARLTRAVSATPMPDTPQRPSVTSIEPAAEVRRAVAGAFRVPRTAWLVSLLSLALGLLLSVSIGSSDLGFGQVVSGLVDGLPGITIDSGLTSTQESILWQWRLPRAVLGALVGASLAMSGAVFQGVFRNPLADPYLLGVAAGAGLGATLAIVTGARHGWGPFQAVPAAAFLGGLLAVGIAAILGFGSSRSAASLLLSGVAVASFFTACQTYVMQRNSEILNEVYAWILGRLGTFGWSDVGLVAPYVVVCGLIAVGLARHLDVMQLGDDEATALGINVTVVRAVLVIVASLLAAAAVSVSGLIAFVGIIVPHVIRLVVGASYRVVVPLSAVAGAAFLVLADIGARNLVTGAELPIGVVTAFFGAPFFAVLLWSRKGSWT
ncbi:MAG: iron ABC transporter permease [Acidimicrobiia bacterium]|nr:iron ABC transporter permease [Acidimicrobiia bacterium]